MLILANMNLTYISYKNTITVTSFTYCSCLDQVYKESLSQIATFLGVSVSKSANKPFMIGKIDSSAKSNPADVLEKLCVKELVGEFIKVGSDPPLY